MWPDKYGWVIEDPKPLKRKRSPAMLKRFRLENVGEPCDLCGIRTGTDVHHKIFRSRGGGDEPENLQWVCRICHDAAHGIRSAC